MNPFQSLVLGAVQGASEFLPISSSAHLVLLPWAARWEDPGLSYDVALHLGTLAAILAYFAKDWITLAKDGLTRPSSPEGLRLWKLAAATVPGGAAGLLFEKAAEHAFRSPPRVAFNLIAVGLLLGWAETRGTKTRSEKDITWSDALWIGFAQAFAIAPGVSRSGATITAGLLLGLTPSAAARFSFLLSGPLLAGAGLLKLRHIIGMPLDAAFWLGIGASAAVGFAAIGFLLSMLRTRSFRPFVVYRVLVGAAVLSLWFLRG